MSLTTMATTLENRFQPNEEITSGEFSAVDGESEIGSQPGPDSRTRTSRIFRGEDLESGETVAIKVLIQATSRLPEFRSRFQRDAAILQAFEHPNVVKTIASGLTSDGQPYCVEEFLRGRTLAEVIANDGLVTPEEMGRQLIQMASGLDAAHARGIVHRDINPGSIMILDDHSGSADVKLLDFGLAKDLSRSAESQAELTSKHSSLGKAAYLSPEQARGGEIDGRSDVYSLGVTLYEALSGHLPFEGETDFQILLAQINGSIPPFPEGWTDHPNASEIEAVILKSLAKDPADRPATAGALSQLFQEALQAPPLRKSGLARPWIAGVAVAVVIPSLFFLAKWLL